MRRILWKRKKNCCHELRKEKIGTKIPDVIEWAWVRVRALQDLLLKALVQLFSMPEV
jgi:hypothetical protein